MWSLKALNPIERQYAVLLVFAATPLPEASMTFACTLYRAVLLEDFQAVTETEGIIALLFQGLKIAHQCRQA